MGSYDDNLVSKRNDPKNIGDIPDVACDTPTPSPTTNTTINATNNRSNYRSNW